VTPPSAPDTVGKSVAVMWSATVQSACAIRSALPVLQQAEDVWILTNRDNPKADPAALADYLGDYGVKAEAHSFTGAKQTARGRGRAMLAALKELPADLLIMGAYGENRLSVIFGLGRATQKVVTASTVPLLIQR
jgi:nucleotide-binding universal stress UspA family protein